MPKIIRRLKMHLSRVGRPNCLMSFFFLILSFLLCAFLVYLCYAIRPIYRIYASKLSSAKKNTLSVSKYLQFYRMLLQEDVQVMEALKEQGVQSKAKALGLASYLCSYALFPFLGLAFFLHSDINFLIVILSVFIGMKIYQWSLKSSSKKA